MILTLGFTAVAFHILSFLMPKETHAKGKQYIHFDKTKRLLFQISQELLTIVIYKGCIAKGERGTSYCPDGKTQNTAFIFGFQYFT